MEHDDTFIDDIRCSMAVTLRMLAQIIIFLLHLIDISLFDACFFSASLKVCFNSFPLMHEECTSISTIFSLLLHLKPTFSSELSTYLTYHVACLHSSVWNEKHVVRVLIGIIFLKKKCQVIHIFFLHGTFSLSLHVHESLSAMITIVIIMISQTN